MLWRGDDRFDGVPLSEQFTAAFGLFTRLTGPGAQDLEGLYDDYLADRDDVSDLFADMLLSLGTDGCPGTRPPLPECDRWLDLEVSTPIIRHYATVFFDAELYGRGEGATDGVFPPVTVSP